MKKRCLSLVCVMALLLSLSGVNVYASEERVMVDGSYLTHDEEVVGEAVLVTRGDDLQAGTSKVSKASSTAINAGGTTTAKHTVSNIGITVIVERLKKGTSSWTYYKTWDAIKTNTSVVSSSKKLTVSGGYYYRVRSTHWANSDVSSSYTNGLYME